MEQDKARIARLSSPFTAFLVTAKETEKTSLSHQPTAKYSASNSNMTDEQALIYNAILDPDEKKRIQRDMDRKLKWQHQRATVQNEYNLLSTEEKEILREGEYYNRRGYYKFLKSKKLEKLNQEIRFLQAKATGTWHNLDMRTSDQYEKMPMEFQSLFTKSHPRLSEMIEFWERFVVFREKALTSKDKLYELVMTRIDIFCDICSAPMMNNQEIGKHIKAFH